MSLVPGETLLYASGEWEVFSYPKDPFLYIYGNGSQYGTVKDQAEARAVVDRMVDLAERVERRVGGEILKGDRVLVTMMGEGLSGEYAFVKISGSGFRVVRSDDGIEFALYPNDLMSKL